MVVTIKTKNDLRFGTYEILGIKGTIPTQAITTVNLEHAKEADEPNFDFGTNFLEIIEMEPHRLIEEQNYCKMKTEEIKQIIQKHPNKLCLLALKGIKNEFRITKYENEFLMKFQIDCGFKFIKIFFRLKQNAVEDLKHFRNQVKSKKKIFVACIDEKLPSKIFESIYLNCVKEHDEIISFFGRQLNKDNASNFTLLISRETDKVIRLNSMIFKTNKGVINSVARNLLGYDCFSFLQKPANDNKYFKLVALDGLYFNTLTNDTTLICVLTGDNLYTSTRKFKKNQSFEYLPIYIHDIVRLNQLFVKLHTNYSRKKLLELFGDRKLQFLIFFK